MAPAAAAGLLAGGASLFDTRGRMARWTRGLAGAAPFDWTAWRAESGRTGLLTDDRAGLRRALTDAGLRPDRPVLIAGEGPGGFCEEGRLAWTLHLLGHPRVRVVDGGAEALRKAAGQAPSPALPGPTLDWLAEPPARVDLAGLLDRAPATTVWDCRSDAEFHGATPYLEARGGHVPGARHLHWKALFADGGALLPLAALQARITAAGIPIDRPVICLCTGGVRSGMAWLVLQQLQHPDARNYDGGMWEYSARADLPLDS